MLINNCNMRLELFTYVLNYESINFGRVKLKTFRLRGILLQAIFFSI
jgi:hypothetical protein